MASLSIRKLDDTTYEALRQQAARHGVSMEEEARQILTRAVNVLTRAGNAPERLGDLFLKYFGSDNGVDLELHDPAPPSHL